MKVKPRSDLRTMEPTNPRTDSEPWSRPYRTVTATGVNWSATGDPSGELATPLTVIVELPVPTASNMSAASRPVPDAPAWSPLRVITMSTRPATGIDARRERGRDTALTHERPFLDGPHAEHVRVERHGQRHGRQPRGVVHRDRYASTAHLPRASPAVPSRSLVVDGATGDTRRRVRRCLRHVARRARRRLPECWDRPVAAPTVVGGAAVAGGGVAAGGPAGTGAAGLTTGGGGGGGEFGTGDVPGGGVVLGCGTPGGAAAGGPRSPGGGVRWNDCWSERQKAALLLELVLRSAQARSAAADRSSRRSVACRCRSVRDLRPSDRACARCAASAA